MTTVWVTKWCLSRGIERADGNLENDSDRVSVAFEDADPPGEVWLRIGRDCFLTEAQALRKAEKQRVRMIAKLRRRIEYLDGLRFEAGVGARWYGAGVSAEAAS